MDRIAREKLREMVARFGTSLAEEAQRTEGLLRDLCADSRREIFVLVSSVKERVAVDLLNGRHVPSEVLLGQLTRRLSDNLALSEDAARWAVESWAIALGVVEEAELVEAARAAQAALPSIVVDPELAQTEIPVAAAHRSPAGHVPAGAGEPRRKTVKLDAVAPVDALAPSGSAGEVPVLIVSKLGRGHFTTINKAIQSAPLGARILVKPGLYTEGVILDRPLELVGDGPLDEIVIEASDSDCVAMYADYAVLRNLTLRGRAGRKGKEFFGVDAARGRLVVEDCDISSDSLPCVAIHNANASPILRRCRIHDGKQVGILVYGGGEGTIEDCDLDGNTAGLVIAAGGNPTVRRTRIHSGKTGLYVYEGGRGLVEESAIFDNGTVEVQVRSGGDPILRGCKIRDGKGFGLYVFDDGRGTFEECAIFGCQNAGVVVFQGGAPTLRRCEVRDGSAEGIYVFEAGRALVEDCDVFGNRRAGIAILQQGAPTILRTRVHDGESVGLYVSDGGLGTLRDCELFLHAGANVLVEKGADPQLTGCKIHDGRDAGIQIGADGRGRFEGCEIWGHARAGVHVAARALPHLRFCTVRGQSEVGVWFEPGALGLVEDSNLAGNGTSGVHIEADADPVVRRCRIQRNAAHAVEAVARAGGSVEECDLSGNALGPWDLSPDAHVRRIGNRA